ncbi:hypothetical protein HDU76_009544, partial [Blyttiomyces sp. JEL0837]
GLSLQDQPISSTSTSLIHTGSNFLCGEDVLPIYGKVVGNIADNEASVISEAESGYEEIVDGTNLDEVRRVVVERQEIMTNNLRKNEWAVEPSPFHDKRLMFKHKTASKITHKSLHPSVYSNLHRLGSFKELAERIGVSLKGFNVIWDLVWRDEHVQDCFDQFRWRIEDTPEDQIQADLQELCMSIKIVLAARFKIPRAESIPHRTVIVGGFVAFPEYDFRSNTDFLVKERTSGEVVFATEIKTDKTFEEGHLWYRGSRGPQKLLTVPFNDEGQDEKERPHVCARMGENFVKALTICLLPRVNPSEGTSADDELVAVGVGGDPNKGEEIIQLKQVMTVKKSTPHRVDLSAAKPLPPWYTKSSASNPVSRTATSPSPKFPVGVDEAGETIWQEIIVWTPEQVAEWLEREEEERSARLSEEELTSQGENALADDDEGEKGMKAETVIGSQETLIEEMSRGVP